MFKHDKERSSKHNKLCRRCSVRIYLTWQSNLVVKVNNKALKLPQILNLFLDIEVGDFNHLDTKMYALKIINLYLSRFIILKDFLVVSGLYRPHLGIPYHLRVLSTPIAGLPSLGLVHSYSNNSISGPCPLLQWDFYF